MEDLLNEEDFLSKKTNYNPRKYFKLFYGIAVLHYILSFILIAMIGDNVFVTLLLIISPNIMVFVMVFLNKRIAELPLKTILSSMFFLLAIYYVITLFMVLILVATPEAIIYTSLAFVFCFIFCSVPVSMIVKVKQKNRKYIN